MHPLASKILDTTSQFPNLLTMHNEVTTVCNHMHYPALRIAVFAPFNHGKSTLLNAILGSKTLPISLVPTTGTAITIKHARSVLTRIQLQGGKTIAHEGTNLLQEYSTLDNERRMRSDVTNIEVFCPHPLLAKRVELIDLPGTDDMESQDILVYNNLLSVDLVISVLDARKLLTMGEVDKLQHWLYKRGIKTAIFVLNFANLIEEHDVHIVMESARFIAREFRGNLPNNLSNIHRVDALDGLRAVVKGDTNLATKSGLTDFNRTLNQMVDFLLPKLESLRLPRLHTISNEVTQALKERLLTLDKEVQDIDAKINLNINRMRQEAQQMQHMFDVSVQNLVSWAATDGFIKRYENDCLQALINSQLDTFYATLATELNKYFAVSDGYLNAGCNKFGTYANRETLYLPKFPQIKLPDRPAALDEESGTGAAGFWGGVAGFILGGGPLGAAAGAAIAAGIASESAKTRKQELAAKYQLEINMVQTAAVRRYLEEYSQTILNFAQQYKRHRNVFSYLQPAAPAEVVSKRKLIEQVQNHLNIIRDMQETRSLKEQARF